MSSENDYVTAHVEKTALIQAIDSRNTAWKEQIAKLRLDYAAGLDALVAEQPTKGILWWKRLKTREEIEEDYTEFWRNGWDIIREIARIGETLRRFQTLSETVSRSSVTNVRLPENDLVILREYL